MLANLSHQRLRFVLSTLLILVFCLPAVLAGVGFYHYTKRMVTEEVTFDLAALAQAKADGVRDWIEERAADAKALARLGETRKWVARGLTGDRAASDSLQTFLTRVGAIICDHSRTFETYGLEGQRLDPSSGSPHLDSGLIDAVRTDGMAVSTTGMGQDAERPELALFVPIAVPPDSFRATLAVRLSAEPLYDQVTRVYSVSTEHVHLADSDGRLLMSVGGPDYIPAPLAPSGNGGDRGYRVEEPGQLLHYEDERNVKIVGSLVTLPDFGWTLLVERDYDDAFQRLMQLHTVLWSLLIAIVLLGSILSIVIANLTVNRLEHRERELRTTHQQLITADRLASVGMMAASVAHEINNPLTTIKVLIHSLREHLAEDDIRRDDLGVVLTEIDKMKALVLRFLQFARPRDPEFSSVDLGRTLARIVSLIRPQVQGKGLTLVERYDESAGPVWADAAQIGQVFLNILLNAVDATPSGGEIHVSMVPGGDGGVTATIWNSGPGLPDELRERIFEPFFSTKPTGTGLGLSIARTIVGKHRGTIRAAGYGEKGTSFMISLPDGSKEMAHASRSDR